MCASESSICLLYFVYVRMECWVAYVCFAGKCCRHRCTVYLLYSKPMAYVAIYCNYGVETMISLTVSQLYVKWWPWCNRWCLIFNIYYRSRYDLVPHQNYKGWWYEHFQRVSNSSPSGYPSPHSTEWLPSVVLFVSISKGRRRCDTASSLCVIGAKLEEGALQEHIRRHNYRIGLHCGKWTEVWSDRKKILDTTYKLWRQEYIE